MGREGLPPEHRPRRRRITSEEARVWRAVTHDVAPLPGRSVDEVDPEPVTVPPPPEPPRAAMPAAMPPPPRGPLPELAHGRVVDLDKRTAERMKEGAMALDARIDLHGMTQDAAHGALTSFVSRSFDRGARCVLVITGKGREGGGVLRTQVPRWLNQSPLRERILGFSYAKPQHGGEGALYVLLKRRR